MADPALTMLTEVVPNQDFTRTASDYSMEGSQTPRTPSSNPWKAESMEQPVRLHQAPLASHVSLPSEPEQPSPHAGFSVVPNRVQVSSISAKKIVALVVVIAVVVGSLLMLSKLRTTQHHLTETSARLATTAAGLKATETKLVFSDTQLSSAKRAITTLNGHVTSLNGQVGTLTGTVASLNGQVDSLNGQVTSYKGQVATANEAAANSQHQAAAANQAAAASQQQAAASGQAANTANQRVASCQSALSISEQILQNATDFITADGIFLTAYSNGDIVGMDSAIATEQGITNTLGQLVPQFKAAKTSCVG